MSLNSTGISAISQQGGISNFASGIYTGDGSGSIQVNAGFTPRYVQVVDITDITTWEWQECFPTTNTLKSVAAGTQTIDTGSLIVANVSLITVTEVAPEGTPGQQGPGEGTLGTVTIEIDNPALNTPQLTFASGLNTTGKVYCWLAQG
jgi:hypothetical protein